LGENYREDNNWAQGPKTKNGGLPCKIMLLGGRGFRSLWGGVGSAKKGGDAVTRGFERKASGGGSKTRKNRET